MDDKLKALGYTKIASGWVKQTLTTTVTVQVRPFDNKLFINRYRK